LLERCVGASVPGKCFREQGAFLAARERAGRLHDPGMAHVAVTSRSRMGD